MPLTAVEKTLPVLEASEQQDQAFALLVEWHKKSRKTRVKPFILSGYAGTGKTTLLARRVIPYLQENNVPYTINTFTGKAASVLAQKGVPNPGTIHSLIYKRVVERDGSVHWMRRDRIEAEIVGIDEGSMVNGPMQMDVESFGRPVFYFGDNAQLPPVGTDVGLMDHPDFQLTEIHRQAAKSPIIRLSQAIRTGMDKMPLGSWGDDERGRLTIARGSFNPLDFDMMICAMNHTRHRLNARKRTLLRRTDLIEVGDLLICLKNDKHSSLRNGSLVRVTEVVNIGKTQAHVMLVDDATGETFDQHILTSCFGKDGNRDEWMQTDALPFDYGYALTCHKAQGSQARKVAVVDEPLRAVDRRRWRYTAFTRAEHELHVYL